MSDYVKDWPAITVRLPEDLKRQVESDALKTRRSAGKHVLAILEQHYGAAAAPHPTPAAPLDEGGKARRGQSRRRNPNIRLMLGRLVSPEPAGRAA